MNEVTLKESIKITNNFSALRTKKNWNRLEQIIVYAISKQKRKELVQLKKEDFIKLKVTDIDVSSIDRKIKLDRNTLISMGFNKDKFSREIRNVSSSLLEKKIITTHPERISCSDSFAMVNWFNAFFYDKYTGIISVEINEYALKLLKYFFKYAFVSPNHIVNLKSDYSFNIYIAAKVDLDSSKGKCNKYEISLDDFRDSFDINDKYRSINMLKKKVLDLIASHINEYTDINISYELLKEGRAYNKIRFLFNYKKEYVKDETSKDNNTKNILENDLSKEVDSLDYSFETTLISWGIRAKVITELEEKYQSNHDAIYKAIDITEQAIKKDKIKNKSPGGYFIKVLENKEYERQHAVNLEKQEIEKEIKRTEKVKKDKEYDKLCSFIFSNENAIASAITTYTKCLPITDHDVKPIFEEIKKIDADKYRGYETEVISFYHFEFGEKTPLSLSEVVDWASIIKVHGCKNYLETIEAYKQAYEKIKGLDYFSDKQKEQLEKEVQDSVLSQIGNCKNL